jgi:hypothetical protein
MQFEAESGRFNIDTSFIVGMWRAWRNKEIQYKNWTVTDFDHCLEGNVIHATNVE